MENRESTLASIRERNENGDPSSGSAIATYGNSGGSDCRREIREMIVSLIKIVNQIVAHVLIQETAPLPVGPIRGSHRLNVFKCKR
ncbi:unnamed protein product [Lasius platythorax]|uniref:Uncharacterized protein n=1 Tax=Lasius platythorax TaxID=488582 RepID=A0AAV2NZQ0_9HYME